MKCWPTSNADVIFVDSNVPMYLVGAPHPNRERLEAFLRSRPDEDYVTSAEVYQEMLHRFVAIDRRPAIRSCRSIVVHPPPSNERRRIRRNGALLARDADSTKTRRSSNPVGDTYENPGPHGQLWDRVPNEGPMANQAERRSKAVPCSPNRWALSELTPTRISSPSETSLSPGAWTVISLPSLVIT